jgi:hypothetical protein
MKKYKRIINDTMPKNLSVLEQKKQRAKIDIQNCLREENFGFINNYKYKINLYDFSFQRDTERSHICGFLFVS